MWSDLPELLLCLVIYTSLFWLSRQSPADDGNKRPREGERDCC
jgi:hypothetical protein